MYIERTDQNRTAEFAWLQFRGLASQRPGNRRSALHSHMSSVMTLLLLMIRV